MKPTQDNFARELRFAKSLYGDLSKTVLRALSELIQKHQLSVTSGDVKYLDGGWYITHSGLLRLAERRRCAGIHCRPVLESSDPPTSRWVFRAAVFKSRACRGFVGYGDADPSNVSALVHGAEMRVAETRAVSRALRKAYGIGICSVEEIGSFAEPQQTSRASKKLPPQPVNGNNGGPKVRDRLCQAAEVPSSKVTDKVPRSPSMNSRIVAALVSRMHSMISLPETPTGLLMEGVYTQYKKGAHFCGRL